MQSLLLIFQIISGVLLSGLVLLQVKGTGFGRVWGGNSASFSRRGLESVVFKFTFVIAFMFLAVSMASLII